MRLISDKGFTLVEMMVVIAIIGILMGVAMPALLSQRPLWRANGAARELLTNMRMTQSKAVRAGDPFAIVFESAPRTYTIFKDDGAGTGTAGDGIQNGTEVTVKTVTLATGLKYGVIGNPTPLKGGAIQPDGINFVSRGVGKSVIFRPDGSAEDGTIYIYPETSTLYADWQRAVEVVGNTGRVKIFSWDIGSTKWL